MNSEHSVSKDPQSGPVMTAQTVQSATEPDSESETELESWLFGVIKDASENTAQIFFLYVGALVYCALTVVSVNDQRLILNEAVRLPIFDLDVPCTGFFILAPLVLIFAFVYLQIYLARLRHLIRRCPEKSQHRLYPWLLNIAEHPDPNPVGWCQKEIVAISLWWLLPVVLALFAVMFVKKHAPVLGYVVAAFPALAAVLSYFFHYQDIKFRKSPPPARSWTSALTVVVVIAFIAFESSLLFFVIPEANAGRPPEFLRSLTCVDLSFRTLVTEPKDESSKTLYWASLNGMHLEGANLAGAILKRADMRNIHLDYALLGSSNLQGADLTHADLNHADFEKANLVEAVLDFSNLAEADFKEANLQNASLQKAAAEGTDFSAANMQCVTADGAKFKGTKFAGSILMQTYFWEVQDLTVDQLQDARTLYLAELSWVSPGKISKPELNLKPQPNLGKGEDPSLFEQLGCKYRPLVK